MPGNNSTANYTEEALQEAMDAVKNGLGQRLAAKEFGVPKKAK